MSIESIKAAAGGALMQVGAAIQAGRAWLGKTIYWLMDTVISWDIPGKLFALGKFLIIHIGKFIDWSVKNVTTLYRYSRNFFTKVFSWGAVQTNALRETTVIQGKRALSYSSKQMTSASSMTCSFIAANWNLSIAVSSGTLSLATLFYASFYAENKALKTALILGSAGGLVLTGVALGSTTPLLIGLI